MLGHVELERLNDDLRAVPRNALTGSSDNLLLRLAPPSLGLSLLRTQQSRVERS